MWYKNIAGRFFGLITKHACDTHTDGRTDRQTDRRTELQFPRPRYRTVKICRKTKSTTRHAQRKISECRAITEGPRDTLSLLKSCQLLCNCTENRIWLEGLPFPVVLKISPVGSLDQSQSMHVTYGRTDRRTDGPDYHSQDRVSIAGGLVFWATVCKTVRSVLCLSCL